MRICVIGCGGAGLAVLRVLSEKIGSYQTTWEVYGYERTNSIGGVWNYDKDIDREFTSPIYNELKTNLPKEAMSYPDFPFPKDIQNSFICHTEVLAYINDYAKKYDLEKFIQFNSEIKNVEPVVTNDVTEWKVSMRDTQTLRSYERVFDVVIVANGHFEQARIPDIEGIENFKGEVLHCKYYRVAERYRNKIVFILGAKNSGTDIALQLSKVAQKVYLSHNINRLQCKNVLEVIQETCGISRVDPAGVICTKDGVRYEADVIMFCTGYEICMDFLSKQCRIEYDNSWIRPLYKNMISPYYPTSLFVVGACYEITPFTFFYMQSKVIRAVLQNCAQGVSLSTSTLLEEIAKENEEFDADDVQIRHRHFYNTRQWAYYRWCERVAHDLMTATVPRHLEHMSNIVKKWRFENTDVYREFRFELFDGNELGFIIKAGPKEDFYSSDFENYLRNAES